LPAISLLSGFTKEKRPLGLQLIGAQNRDATVLAFAHAFEKTSEDHKKIPPLFDDEARHV